MAGCRPGCFRTKLLSCWVGDNGVHVITTGSSSFDPNATINEPLTGRKFEFILYLLSFSELEQEYGLLEKRRLLEHRLVSAAIPRLSPPSDRKRNVRLLAYSRNVRNEIKKGKKSISKSMEYATRLWEIFLPCRAALISVRYGKITW